MGAEGDPEEALKVYRSRYSTVGLFEAVVYDGVKEALADLRAAGTRLFLCTAKPSFTPSAFCSHFDLDRHFEAAYGDELGGRFQDKADLVAHILEREGLEPGECCMLGDRRHDVLAASRHGIPTIGALWGYGGADELRAAGAAVLCASPSEVPAAFWALSGARPSRPRGRHDRRRDPGRPPERARKPRCPTPPRAEARPTRLSAHGLSWADDYAWIRADNWREVLRDPSRLPADIRALLKAENAYADAVLAPTAGLQKELRREMRARLKEDDSEPPQVDGPWAYYSRFRPGGQRRIYCRKPREGGAETVLIDGDARAEGKAFFHFAGGRHSPDHAKFAWSSDDLGSEILTIAVRDLERETDLADRVGGATGDVVWTRDFDGVSLRRAG